MKTKGLFVALIALIMCFVTGEAFAYDIAVENEDGVTIYYNYINEGTELAVTRGNNNYSGSVVIPEEVTFMNRTRKVTSIGVGAFRDCSGLTSVTIPGGVTSIETQAFKLSSLTSITIPNSVTSIGESAFSDCSGLTSAILGNGVTRIGDQAFNECSSLTTLTIPESVTSIGYFAFNGCTSLTSVTIPNSVTSIASYAFCKCYGLTSVIIGNSLTTIENDMFYLCTSLTSVIIGNSVKYIKLRSFYGCSSLTSVTIPNSVKSIGKEAFHSCSGLTSVTFGNGVTSIGEKAFRKCSSLTSVTIPSSVTSIGVDAFYGCSSLTSVTIPNSVTSIEMGMFQDCYSLPSVIIPNSVTSIGNYAFNNCRSLTSVTIPNSVKSIGGYSFENCLSLTSVTIPNSVTNIGQKSFEGCNIESVISLIEEPSAIKGKSSDNRTFSLNTFNNATLYVPVGTIDKYKATEGWKDFMFIEEGDGGGGITPETKVCAKPTIHYQNGQLSFKCATEGAEFKYDIKDSDVTYGSGSTVDLNVTYHISVYATREGYTNSELATATLCWIDVEPQKEGITGDEDAVTEVKAMPVLIQSEGSGLTIEGAEAGTPIRVYDLSGRLIGNTTAAEGATKVNVAAAAEKVVVVKVGERAVKVAR